MQIICKIWISDNMLKIICLEYANKYAKYAHDAYSAICTIYSNISKT